MYSFFARVGHPDIRWSIIIIIIIIIITDDMLMIYILLMFSMAKYIVTPSLTLGIRVPSRQIR
jgi:hypothetical protein